MEEIKNVKQEKSSKKQFVVSLMVSLAIIFFLLGILDIKSNAAESNTIKFSIVYEQEDINTGTIDYYGPGKYTVISQGEMEMYVYQSHFERTTEPTTTHFFIVSDSPISMTCGSSSYTSTGFTQNGKTRYCIHNGGNTNGVVASPHLYRLTFETEVNYKSLATGYYNKQKDFINDYINDNLGFVIDYDSFEVDDDMLVPEDVKYNIVVDNNSTSAIGDRESADVYDVLTWKNTSSVYYLQLESIPIVQYRKINMALNSYGIVHDDILIKEFKDEWRTEKIFEEVTNTFSKYSNGLYMMLEDKDAYDFKSFCDETYEKNVVTEESNLVFGYRLRYLDVVNEKASVWVYLMPTGKEYSYSSFVEYSDGSKSDSTDSNGLFNEYDDLDDIENAKTDINIENEFKDKYEIVDGDVDVQEATNWLYSVVNFIKGTPQVVGSVLGFLPQPILYGMYVCIFLGIIASGIAIVKALF